MRPAVPTLHHDVVVRRVGRCCFISKTSLAVVHAMTMHGLVATRTDVVTTMGVASTKTRIRMGAQSV